VRKRLLQIPSYDELVQLLMAWRVYLVGAVLGALAATAVFTLMPHQYRAQATVLVNQHAEEAVPEERNDLRIYTFLGRETEKLVEIAWSDGVLNRVSEQTGIPVAGLRGGSLLLSQPSDGGWHFIAQAADPGEAAGAAAAWAQAFYDVVQARPEGINPLVEVNLVQVDNLPIQRTGSPGGYIFSGALIGAVVLALGLLFFGRKGEKK
jgi:hypothetical protein